MHGSVIKLRGGSVRRSAVAANAIAGCLQGATVVLWIFHGNRRQAPITKPPRIVLFVPRLLQPDSAAFADDYANGNVNQVAGCADDAVPGDARGGRKLLAEQVASSAGLPHGGYVSDCGADQ